MTTTQSAPEAAAGVTVFVWGAAGRSVMPAELVDSVAALRTAAAELIAVGRAAGPRAHPCDVRFGRDITRVLAEAEAQLFRHRSQVTPRAGHCTYVHVSA